MSVHEASNMDGDTEERPLLENNIVAGGHSTSQSSFERKFSKIFWIFVVVALGTLAVVAIWLVAPHNRDGGSNVSVLGFEMSVLFLVMMD